jgi:hypothetical protein
MSLGIQTKVESDPSKGWKWSRQRPVGIQAKAYGDPSNLIMKYLIYNFNNIFIPNYANNSSFL